MIFVRNKRYLTDEIIECRIGLEMIKIILAQVQKFERYKQVNKKFTDSFTGTGIRAVILKDNFQTKIRFYQRVNDTLHSQSIHRRVDISITSSHFFSPRPITWADIKLQLFDYHFEERLETAEETLAALEDEKIRLKEMIDLLDNYEFKCFDLWRIRSELKTAYLELIK